MKATIFRSRRRSSLHQARNNSRSFFAPTCSRSQKRRRDQNSASTSRETNDPRRVLLHNPSLKRLFSSASAGVGGEKLRVAVVGGGCAGLSAALHLAPLVEEGLVASPIDIFDPRGGAGAGRNIGVGLWTTALDPFGKSQRESHQQIYQQLTQEDSSVTAATNTTWLGRVGYRTPNGAWLIQSRLPGSWKEHVDTQSPGLLFLRERDLLHELLKAVLWEEQLGTLKLHRARVSGVAHDDWWSRGQVQHPWSARLELTRPKRSESNGSADGDSDDPPENSERDYHLIVAADGTYSKLRSRYGGHSAMVSAAAAPSATSLSGPSMDVSASAASAAPSSTAASSWNQDSHEEAIGLQDRNYTVFRGNAPLTSAELNELDPLAKLDDTHHVSFQTWGTHKSMRFATVPMFCPPSNNEERKAAAPRREHQVWFITVNDTSIAKEADPRARRDLLLQRFRDWHAPIQDIVQATDPESILVERAIAHRHCMGPVVNLNRVLQQQTSAGSRHSLSEPSHAGGPGPALVFLGDAYMTVDPILAQGFTVAMEGSFALHQSVRRALVATTTPPRPLGFDPLVLRDQLGHRHEARMDRLVCLLRATEVVQALGQPEGGSLSGSVNTLALRPLIKVTPNIIKQPLFDRVLKYSLGL